MSEWWSKAFRRWYSNRAFGRHGAWRYPLRWSTEHRNKNFTVCARSYSKIVINQWSMSTMLRVSPELAVYTMFSMYDFLRYPVRFS